MRHGRIFAQSKVQTSFFDGIAALRALHEALEQHRPFRHFLSSASKSFAAQLPDNAKLTSEGTSVAPLLREPIAVAVTELFVSMNLHALCMHVLRGTLADLVPFANQILEMCLNLPLRKIPQPAPTGPGNSKNDDDDDEEDSIHFLMKVVGNEGVFSSVEAEHARQQQIRHQVFLCQSLVAVGLATEAVNPLMARCVYNLANLRMTTTLGIATVPSLREVLHSPSVCLLKIVGQQLKTPMPAACGSYAEHYFLSWQAGGSAAAPLSSAVPGAPRGADTVHEVGKLPPAHCAIQIPLRR
jgi:hypothetical protein